MEPLGSADDEGRLRTTRLTGVDPVEGVLVDCVCACVEGVLVDCVCACV